MGAQTENHVKIRNALVRLSFANERFLGLNLKRWNGGLASSLIRQSSTQSAILRNNPVVDWMDFRKRRRRGKRYSSTAA